MKKSKIFLILIILISYLVSYELVADDSNIPKIINIKIDINQDRVVYSADDLHCPEKSKYGKMDVPDAPVRAVRMKDGEVIVFAAHYNNLVFRDVDFNHFKRISCKSSLVSGEDPDPSHFSNHEWVLAPYSPDGRIIFSLVHNEHWGALDNIVCKIRLGLKAPWDSVCLYANLTYATSIDGGISFDRPNIENRVIASIQYPFSSDMDRAGVRDPSNIFLNPNDKKIYFLAYADNYMQQKVGMCLFRTENINNTVWHVWDGIDFSKTMGNPYNNKPDQPPVICSPISNFYVSGVVYHEKTGQFIGVGFDEKANGIFFVSSKDLIHWTEPKTILIGKSINKWFAGDMPPIGYVSIIDEKSSSLNFDTISDNAYIYFIRFPVKEGKINGRERDIVKIPINIEFK